GNVIVIIIIFFLVVVVATASLQINTAKAIRVLLVLVIALSILSILEIRSFQSERDLFLAAIDLENLGLHVITLFVQVSSIFNPLLGHIATMAKAADVGGSINDDKGTEFFDLADFTGDNLTRLEITKRNGGLVVGIQGGLFQTELQFALLWIHKSNSALDKLVNLESILPLLEIGVRQVGDSDVGSDIVA